jgi:hypothetical protein
LAIARDVGQRIFGRREDGRNRLDLRQDHEPGLVGGVDDVALIDQAHAGATGNRRGDRRVAELDPGVVDRGLVGLDVGLELGDQGPLRVHALSGGRAALLQMEKRSGRASRRRVAPRD